ncbi:MAG: hypothetical protein ACRDTF_05420, partial [Pseudonocardiaceae bacterium]
LGKLDELATARAPQVAAPAGTGFTVGGKFGGAVSQPSKIFFDRGGTIPDAAELSKIPALATPANRALTLRGFASEDETNRPMLVSNRIAFVDTNFAAANHTGVRTADPRPDDGQGQLNYRAIRLVEVVPAGGASTTPNCQAGAQYDCGPLPNRYSTAASLYEEIKAARRAGSWTNSHYEGLMRFAARRFGLTAPPATPVESDQHSVAGMNFRHSRLARAASQPVTVTKAGAGVDTWAPGPGNQISLTDAFFRLTARQQVDTLLTMIIQASSDIEAAHQQPYVVFTEDMRPTGAVTGPMLAPVSLVNPFPLRVDAPLVAYPDGDRLHVLARDPARGQVRDVMVDAEGHCEVNPNPLPLAYVHQAISGGPVVSGSTPDGKPVVVDDECVLSVPVEQPLTVHPIPCRIGHVGPGGPRRPAGRYCRGRQGRADRLCRAGRPAGRPGNNHRLPWPHDRSHLLESAAYRTSAPPGPAYASPVACHGADQDGRAPSAFLALHPRVPTATAVVRT